MPTGYTADIPKGISFEQYALNCARAFGALVVLRDEPNAPIPDSFEPSSYHLKREADVQSELAVLQAMTPAEAQAAADEDYARREAQRLERIDNLNTKLEAYQRMLEKAKAYKAPSPDHENFARFMVDQIESSIKFDCDLNFLSQEPDLMTGEDWRSKQIYELTRQIKYHQREYAEEVARTASRNLWIKQLRESLER